MLSKSAEDALRAVHLLAFRPPETPVPAGEIAGLLELPENSLSKLLHRLQREGVLTSRRGPAGGFALARPPAEVALAEVVRPFDDLAEERRCLLGQRECRDDAPCAAHAEWRDVRETVRRFFHETTLADLGPPTGLRERPAELEDPALERHGPPAPVANAQLGGHE